MSHKSGDFVLFGLGRRRKMVYRKGALIDLARRGEIRRWDVAEERIHPAGPRVQLRTRAGESVVIRSDEHGIWIEEHGQAAAVSHGPISLPAFEGHRYAALLQRLLIEVLLNVVDGVPLPNLLVYRRPWYRDAAMVCMVLQRTGQLELVRDWIMGLDELYDRNHRGDGETDNLGQTLYMISLVSDAAHPLVRRVLEEAERCRRDEHLGGRTDFAEHPVYQTKWLKFGLRSLGLEDGWKVPATPDSYSALFWMDYRDQHVASPAFSARDRESYPYLAWAEAHFHGWEPPMQLAGDGTGLLTWEAEASEADYEGMAVADPALVARKVCVPHSWHAAEMFLYLHELG